jgi:hypothetical protein
VAEASDLLVLVEDVAVDFHLAHDLQFADMLEQLIAGDFSSNRDRVFSQLEVMRLILCGEEGTSLIVASVAVAKDVVALCSSRIIFIVFEYQ